MQCYWGVAQYTQKILAYQAGKHHYLWLVFSIGVFCLQYPIGRISDRFDRRLVFLGKCSSAALFALILKIQGKDNYALLLSFMALYGGTSLTLYSLFIAHADDYLTPSQMVSTSSSLVMVNGVGAVLGNPMGAVSMELVRNWSFFTLIGSIHFGLAIFIVYRIMVRQSIPAEAQGPLILLPENATATVVSLNPETKWIHSNLKTVSEEISLEGNPYFPKEGN